MAYQVDHDDPYGELVALAHDLAEVVDWFVTDSEGQKQVLLEGIQ
ncbi:hypothetical protein [Streptomyces sp. NBC_00690]|nr:hypothetical protein [Streptomyces sp. NBC_00690]